METTQIVTGKVRLSYANIWEPKSINGGEAKFSCTILIPKKDKITLKAVENAVEAAKVVGKESKWKGKIPKNLKLPLRDGDQEADEKGEAYVGMMFLNASSKTKPGIVDTKKQPIFDEEQVYSGAWALVNLSFYPFDTNGNTGVAVGLNHIMKVADDEKFSSRISVDAAFADVDTSKYEVDDLG